MFPSLRTSDSLDLNSTQHLVPLVQSVLARQPLEDREGERGRGEGRSGGKGDRERRKVRAANESKTEVYSTVVSSAQLTCCS